MNGDFVDDCVAVTDCDDVVDNVGLDDGFNVANPVGNRATKKTDTKSIIWNMVHLSGRQRIHTQHIA